MAFNLSGITGNRSAAPQQSSNNQPNPTNGMNQPNTGNGPAPQNQGHVSNPNQHDNSANVDANGNPTNGPSLNDPNNFDIEAFMSQGSNENNQNGDKPQTQNGQFSPELASFVKQLQQLDTNNSDGQQQPSNFDNWYQENMPSFDAEAPSPFDHLFGDDMSGELDPDKKKAFMGALNDHNKQVAEKLFTNTATMARNLISKMLDERLDGFKGELSQSNAVNKMNERFSFTSDPRHKAVADQMLTKALDMSKGNTDAAIAMVEGYYRSTNPSVFQDNNRSDGNGPMSNGFGDSTPVTADSVADLFRRQ